MSINNVDYTGPSSTYIYEADTVEIQLNITPQKKKKRQEDNTVPSPTTTDSSPTEPSSPTTSSKNNVIDDPEGNEKKKRQRKRGCNLTHRKQSKTKVNTTMSSESSVSDSNHNPKLVSSELSN